MQTRLQGLLPELFAIDSPSTRIHRGKTRSMIAQDIGNGAPLMLIHGFGIDSRIMRALEDTIGFIGYRRIYIDLPWTTGGLNTEVRSASDVLAFLTHELQEYLQRALCRHR